MNSSLAYKAGQNLALLLLTAAVLSLLLVVGGVWLMMTGAAAPVADDRGVQQMLIAMADADRHQRGGACFLGGIGLLILTALLSRR